MQQTTTVVDAVLVVRSVVSVKFWSPAMVNFVADVAVRLATVEAPPLLLGHCLDASSYKVVNVSTVIFCVSAVPTTAVAVYVKVTSPAPLAEASTKF